MFYIDKSKDQILVSLLRERAGNFFFKQIEEKFYFLLFC